MYSQEDFKTDLMALEDALAGSDPIELANAVTRCRSLLKAGGQKGSIVSGSNRSNMQRVLALCESHQVAVAGLVTVEGKAPRGTVDPTGLFAAGSGAAPPKGDQGSEPKPLTGTTGGAGASNVDAGRVD